jgi:hypothetical protein
VRSDILGRVCCRLGVLMIVVGVLLVDGEVRLRSCSLIESKDDALTVLKVSFDVSKVFHKSLLLRSSVEEMSSIAWMLFDLVVLVVGWTAFALLRRVDTMLILLHHGYVNSLLQKKEDHIYRGDALGSATSGCALRSAETR